MNIQAVRFVRELAKKQHAPALAQLASIITIIIAVITRVSSGNIVTRMAYNLFQLYYSLIPDL